MHIKHIIIILFALILLPALFYTAYEFNVLSDNEELIEGIYEQQLNGVLFSVNQYAWDVVQNWTISLNRIGLLQEPDQALAYSDFLKKNRSIRSLLFADTSFTALNQMQLSERPTVPNEQLIAFLKTQPGLFSQLINQYQAGYSKIEPVNRRSENGLTDSGILLVFINESQAGELQIGGIILDIDIFINDILGPKIFGSVGNEFIIAIFSAEQVDPVFSSAESLTPAMAISKKLWLFPDHRIGISLKGVSIESLARQRYLRSAILIIGLDLILIFAVIFLYRNIRKAVELARLKTDFVSNVSHELRTPLALIRMFAETLELKRVKTKEKAHEYVTIIRQETERLSQIINRILDFSQIEAKKKQYIFKPVDLNQLVVGTLDFYKFHIENNGFILKVNLSKEPLIIRADYESIVEVFINLLDNAIKYSDAVKEITVTTGINQKMVSLEVIDKGIGIAEKDQKKIFNKFYRIREDGTYNRAGSGLGLTLVHSLMKAHEGVVSVSSQPNSGSNFKLQFPIMIEETEKQ